MEDNFDTCPICGEVGYKTSYDFDDEFEELIVHYECSECSATWESIFTTSYTGKDNIDTHE